MSNESLSQLWDQAVPALETIPLVAERMRYAAAIKPLLALPRSAAILEVGCGSGRLLRGLDRLGYNNLTAVEASLVRLGTVREMGPRGARLVCSLEVPFASATFAGVVSAAVIEHVARPRDWLQELARITRPGGVVSLATDSYMWWWLQALGRYHSAQPLDSAIWPWTLLGWAAEARLELVGCGGFVNTPDQRWYFLQQILHILLRTRRLTRWLSRAPAPEIPPQEGTAIAQAAQSFSAKGRKNRLACVFCYECYYWFRKCGVES